VILVAPRLSFALPYAAVSDTDVSARRPAGGLAFAPAPLGSVLAITFLASVSGGAFWSGIFFVTAGHYHFPPARNLALGAAMGFVYALSARYTGALSRRLGQRLSARGILVLTLGIWGLVSLAPLAARQGQGVLWATALVGAVASAATWPVVESYLSAGRHGADMRSAIGWFNVVWTPATAIPLLIMPVVARVDLLGTIALSALFNTGAMLALFKLPPRPPEHAAEASHAAVGPEYAALLRSASWLLPLSYLISSNLAPILPHRLAALDSVVPGSVIAASWMVARFLSLATMWRLGFWHGRWGTLLLAALALAGGLALVLLAPGLGGVVAGLVLFGTGTGLIYYAALYYSLAVGHAQVDAGGNFEALIGLGYCLGPLLGLGGQLLSGGDPARARTATVALVWTAAAGIGLAALRPYVAARQTRRTASR
jgi:hypothetical protein